MAYKIFSKNNYLFIIDTDTDNYILDGKIKDVYFKRLNEPIERYFVVNPIGLTKYILRSEIVKENGSPYLSNEWEDFYTSLTETQIGSEFGVTIFTPPENSNFNLCFQSDFTNFETVESVEGIAPESHEHLVELLLNFFQ